MTELPPQTLGWRRPWAKDRYEHLRHQAEAVDKAHRAAMKPLVDEMMELQDKYLAPIDVK